MSTLPSNVERYLDELVEHLRALPADERQDIRDELAASFHEKIASGAADPLDGFPAPRDYAAQFVAAARGDDEPATVAPPSPARLSRSRAALVFGLGGPLALAFVTAGTMILVVGIAKIFMGARADAFVDDQGALVSFGVFDVPPGHSVFGSAGIVVFIVVGAALAILPLWLLVRGYRWAHTPRTGASRNTEHR